MARDMRTVLGDATNRVRSCHNHPNKPSLPQPTYPNGRRSPLRLPSEARGIAPSVCAAATTTTARLCMHNQEPHPDSSAFIVKQQARAHSWAGPSLDAITEVAHEAGHRSGKERYTDDITISCVTPVARKIRNAGTKLTPIIEERVASFSAARRSRNAGTKLAPIMEERVAPFSARADTDDMITTPHLAPAARRRSRPPGIKLVPIVEERPFSPRPTRVSLERRSQ